MNWWPTKMAPPRLTAEEEERALRCGLWEPPPPPPPQLLPSQSLRRDSQRLPAAAAASWRPPAPPGIRSPPRLLTSSSSRSQRLSVRSIGAQPLSVAALPFALPRTAAQP